LYSDKPTCGALGAKRRNRPSPNRDSNSTAAATWRIIKRKKGFFHYRFQDHSVAGNTSKHEHAAAEPAARQSSRRMTLHCDEIWEFRRM
jgi:hypothetical protein